MTQSERDQLRVTLREEIEKTRAAVKAQAEDNRSIAPDNAIGRVSRVDAMYNQQVNRGTLQRNKERLGKLEYTLARVDTPGFGTCEYCKTPIPLARLKAMPESTTCMRCAAFAR